MESKCAKRPSHKEWRRIAKKERRKRLRQKAARERDQETEQLQKLLDANVDYLQWLEEQNKIKEEEERREAEKHAELEKAWIAVEVKVQKEWEVLQLRKAKARELQIAQEEIIIKEFEEMQENSRKKKEAERRRRDEQKKMFDRMKKEIDAYIDDGSRTPKALRSINETQPGKEICPFFNKTGACRYGDICSRNHQRPSLSTVILVPNFYTHFSLERHSHDYDSDIRLEYDHRETRNHFRDFYFDVVPELEKFGKIKTLQYCKNTESHLRGNLYVEYCSEREAARALRGLKGRWYAGRQLHCEFVNLKSWRGAICGMMRCPKGSACNFLHTFRNPTEDYGVKSPPLWQKRQEQFDRNPSSSSRRGNFSNRRSNWEDHDNGGQDRSRNWRWSESPEQDDRRQGGRSNQFRGQRNYYPRNQFNNRNNYDNNRRNDNRNFYNNRRPRNFNDNRHNRFSDEERDDNRFNKPQRRQFNNFNDRFNKRRYSDSDGYEDYGSSKIRRKEKRSRSRSRSRGSRSRSMSRSPSRSRSRSRGSRSRSHSRSRSRSMTRSKSHSRSLSRSISRSRTRSRSPHPESMIEVDSFPPRKPTSRDMHSAEGASRSVSRERKRRPPSPLHAPKEKTQPKVSHKDRDDVISVSSSNSNHMFGQKGTRKPPTQHVSKWDNEKREDSSTESRDSRSRSRSASPYKEHHLDDIESSMPPQKPPKMQKMQHSQQYSKPPSGNSKGSNQKEYEWDTTESENE